MKQDEMLAWFEKDSIEQAGVSIANCLLNTVASSLCVYIVSYDDLTHAGRSIDLEYRDSFQCAWSHITETTRFSILKGEIYLVFGLI